MLEKESWIEDGLPVWSLEGLIWSAATVVLAGCG